jgi:hemoglobin
MGSGGETREGSTSQAQSICLSVGGGDAAKGAAGIDGVVDQFVQRLASDCAINQFFTALPASGLTHVVDCLKIQVKELFGCPGVAYAGSKDSAGMTCRDMKSSHVGLGISDADYDALIADLVAVLPEGVKNHPDFGAIATALTAPRSESGSIRSAIVESDSTSVTKGSCP